MCDELEDLPSKTSGPPIKFSCSSLVKSWPKLGPVLPIEATAGITGAVVMLANVAGPVVHTAGKQHYVSPFTVAEALRNAIVQRKIL